jgi:hypothetical protein
MTINSSREALACDDRGRTLVRVRAGEIKRFWGCFLRQCRGVHDVAGAFVACRLNTVFGRKSKRRGNRSRKNACSPLVSVLQSGHKIEAENQRV